MERIEKELEEEKISLKILHGKIQSKNKRKNNDGRKLRKEN